MSPNKATVSGGKAGTFTSSEEGNYTVFFSGHSYLGDPLARQFAVAEVSVGKDKSKHDYNLTSCDEIAIPFQLGKMISITASGTIYTGDTPYPECSVWTSADGITGCSRWNFDGLPFMSLLGEANGEHFLVGSKFEKTFDFAGNLHLSVNDTGCWDNQGTLTIHVE